ncbi:MAG: thioredoxin-disulfide reductase [Lachnospiraceae bacterium]|nr:thioredoxin-disulfide reductase [Candidatus Colinaster equi]
MYDIAIIGSGPAGLTAGIYGKRAGLDTVVIDSEPGGGQVLTTYEVDNYPGLPGINGFDLGMKFKDHATDFGVSFVDDDATEVAKSADGFTIKTAFDTIEARSLIIATGAAHNKLNIPGEEELAGMGVSYCATCDGAFFKNKVTAVVGGGDVALEDAIFLARTCTKVYLIHRRDTFRGAAKLAQTVMNTPNIEIIYNAIVTKIEGSDHVESIMLHNNVDNTDTSLTVDGIFVAVGTHPNTELFKGLVDMNDAGYIIADESCTTSTPGIFVAGDARNKPLRQIITAAADGANAATGAAKYLE